MDVNGYKKFLELPEDKRYEYLTGFRLRWYQKLCVVFLNKWWTAILRANSHLKAINLWESIYKGMYQQN